MKDQKPFKNRKPLYTNIVGVIAAILAGYGIGVDTETQAAIVAGVIAVVNICLEVYEHVSGEDAK